jgi:hypothetical protein
VPDLSAVQITCAGSDGEGDDSHDELTDVREKCWASPIRLARRSRSYRRDAGVSSPPEMLCWGYREKLALLRSGCRGDTSLGRIVPT